MQWWPSAAEQVGLLLLLPVEAGPESYMYAHTADHCHAWPTVLLLYCTVLLFHSTFTSTVLYCSVL